MKNVKAPTSKSYHDYLISRLKEPSYAALYLETHLEEDEDFEPELLRLALGNISQALSSLKMSPEQAELHRQELDKILSQEGGDVIYGLAVWLNKLGLKLTVSIADQQSQAVKQ